MLLDEAGREVIVLSESGEGDFFFSRENAGFRSIIFEGKIVIFFRLKSADDYT